MTPSPLELCEDFLAYIPPRRQLDAVVTDRYTWVPRGPGGSIVQRIRLADGGEVHAAVDSVRKLAEEAGRPAVTWWVGELATPDDVVDLLAAEGLVPTDEDPLLASLVIGRQPDGDLSAVEVRRVDTLDDFRAAQEIDLITMGVPEDERDRMLAGASAQWDEIRAEGIIQAYLARVDGRAVAFARAAFGRDAVALLGGGTLEVERGRGYYTALVHARWRDAAARGTPLLVTQAGTMSRPILERLGFEHVGNIYLLVDRL